MLSKLVNIGNSKGIRLPKKLIEKYHLDETLILEEKNEGILIKADIPDNKLSWEETYKETLFVTCSSDRTYSAKEKKTTYFTRLKKERKKTHPPTCEGGTYGATVFSRRRFCR